jgi:hypothetical protein
LHTYVVLWYSSPIWQFDTHKIYSKLIEAGFEKAKADAIVESFAMAQEDVATKGDIELLRKELEFKIDNLKKDLLIHMWTVGATIIGVMAAFNFLG